MARFEHPPYWPYNEWLETQHMLYVAPGKKVHYAPMRGHKKSICG